MIKDKNNSEYYNLGKNCQDWRLVDNRELSVIVEEMAPKTSEEFHLHKNSQQLFYIITRVAEFELDDKKHTVEAGQSFYVEPSLKFRVLNNSSGILKFILISQPTTVDDRYEINQT